MKFNALASIKKQKLQNATAQPAKPAKLSDQSAYIFYQLQYNKHQNTATKYDNTNLYWPRKDSEYKTKIEESKKKKREREEREKKEKKRKKNRREKKDGDKRKIRKKKTEKRG